MLTKEDVVERYGPIKIRINNAPSRKGTPHYSITVPAPIAQTQLGELELRDRQFHAYYQDGVGIVFEPAEEVTDG